MLLTLSAFTVSEPTPTPLRSSILLFLRCIQLYLKFVYCSFVWHIKVFVDMEYDFTVLLPNSDMSFTLSLRSFRIAIVVIPFLVMTWQLILLGFLPVNVFVILIIPGTWCFGWQMLHSSHLRLKSNPLTLLILDLLV